MSNIISKNIKISLLLVATMGVMSGITIVASLPLMSKTFGDVAHIEFLSKMMLTIPSIVIALFAPIVGVIIDKYGRLIPLYIGLLLFVIGGSSGLYLDNFYLILAGRAILGVAVALLMTSSTALIGDYFDEDERHKFMSMQGMAVGIGGIFFITLGGFLADLHWSYPFAVYLLPLLFLPIMLYSLYEPTRHKHTPLLTEAPIKLWPIYLTGYFAMVLFYMMPTQMPYLVVNTFDGEPRTIGFIISIAMFTSAIVSKQYSRLKSKFSYSQIYMITFLFFSLGLFIISKAHSIAQLYYSTVFIGIGFGLIMVNTNAWFLATVPAHKRGKASGVLASSFFLGQFSSPLIFEPIVQLYGIQGLFLIISAVTLLVSILIWFFTKR